MTAAIGGGPEAGGDSAALIKSVPGGSKKSTTARELAIQQIVSRAVVSTEIADLMKLRPLHPPRRVSRRSPRDTDRARARWLEESADSRMGEVVIWHLFNQVAIKRGVWGEPTDPAVVENTLKNDIPRIPDYQETMPANGA